MRASSKGSVKPSFDAKKGGKSDASSDRQYVTALAKGLSVLEAFAQHPAPMSLQQLADRSGLEKSTVQRMVFTLVHKGYLRKGIDGRGYCLGPNVLDRSFDFLRAWPLVERAMPVLDELRQASQERVDLSLFDDLTICYAIRRQSKRQTFYATLIGRRVPTFCSSGGRAVMSRLTDAEVDSIIERSDLTPITGHTITEPDAIRERIALARRDGYSIVYNESFVGEIAVACPVLDHRAHPVAAVHIAGSLSEWTVDAFGQRFAPLAAEAANALSGAVAPF